MTKEMGCCKSCDNSDWVMHCCAWGGLGHHRWHGVIPYENVSFVCLNIPSRHYTYIDAGSQCTSLFIHLPVITYVTYSYLELDLYNSTVSFVFNSAFMPAACRDKQFINVHCYSFLGKCYRNLMSHACMNASWSTHGCRYIMLS